MLVFIECVEKRPKINSEFFVALEIRWDDETGEKNGQLDRRLIERYDLWVSYMCVCALTNVRTVTLRNPWMNSCLDEINESCDHIFSSICES